MTNEIIFDRVGFTPGDLGQPRITNKAWILGLVRSGHGATRSSIADHTGLSKSLVAKAVLELLDNGLVVEGFSESPRIGAGRPSSKLWPVLPDVFVAGVRFEHDRMTVAVADCLITIRGHRTEDIDLDDDPRTLVDRAIRLLRLSLAGEGLSERQLDSIVISIPGPVDRRHGTARAPSVLSSWAGRDVSGLFADLLGRPVHVENDANLGAWGEFAAGAGYEVNDFLYLEVSQGIGAGVMLDGRVYRGSQGVSGEIGHTQVDPSGPLCRCGQNGCVEVVAAAGPVRDKLRAIRGTHRGQTDEDIDDGVTRRVHRDAGYTLGRVISGACNLLNPQLIIVGGQMATSSSYIEGVQEAIRRFVQPVIAESIEVRPSALAREAVMIGALVRAVQLVRTHETELERTGHNLPHSGKERLLVRGTYSSNVAKEVMTPFTGALARLRSQPEDGRRFGDARKSTEQG